MTGEPGTGHNPLPGSIRGTTGASGDEPVTATIDNRTALPDNVIQEAIMARWTDATGALQLAQPTQFQLYSTNHGTMLARTPFQTPRNVIDEIKLARHVADTDDDVKSAMGNMISVAFGEGMQNLHPDEKTVKLYNRVARDMNLDMMLKEMYREYLIASSFTTINLFRRARLNFTPDGTDQKIQAQIAEPLVGIIPAEDIRVTSNDLFGNGELAYLPSDGTLKRWLDEFLDDNTTPGRKAEMARDNPVLATLFTKKIRVPWNDSDIFTTGQTLYVFNPRMVHRTTMPKGAAAYPRPLLTANFALLEAKRLLNIMDYALLQGGTNYIVVAKQGSDQLPAKQPEIDNLENVVRSASRSGVLVGDHRVDIEIITPKLEELLNPAKRKLIGRKIAMALLRMPEQVTNDAGNQGATNEMTLTAATITADRLDIKRHTERWVYDETADRNPSTFTKGSPTLWFPRIILAGAKDFWASVKEARDRGDIPRRYAVEALGYDYDASVAERKREKARGDDEVMTPGAVPFSPQSSPPEGGRPPGSGPNNGRPGSAPSPEPAPRMRPPQPAQAERIIAEWSDERQETVRVGELTATVLGQYPEHEFGRVTGQEREAINSSSTFQSGALSCIPVNREIEVGELRAIRLEEGLGMIVGQRPTDGAIVARAFTFREPHWDTLRAEDTVRRFGYYVPDQIEEETAAVAPSTTLDPNALVKTMTDAMTTAMAEVVKNIPQPNITLQVPDQPPRRLVRDPESGEIIGSEPVPENAGGS